MVILEQLAAPIVLAPLAGGPSTPALAAAVSDAGGLGFLGAGYLTPEALSDRLRETQSLTPRPVGVNLFVISGGPTPPVTYAAYVESLRAEAEHFGVAVGEPRFDDDHFDAKVAALVEQPVAVVSFSFGLPPAHAAEQLRSVGSEIWITVTSSDEARRAAVAGADVLVVQGAEAGGHRGSFEDHDSSPMPLVELIQEVRAEVDLPRVGAGGIATAEHVTRALDAGAAAAAAGTAFMLAPEAGTSAVHREAIASGTPTALTRAFTGRLARGIRNRFMLDHAGAPSAYPEIHYATAPIRAAGRAAGDADVINLWAGTRHALTVARPAADTVCALTPS
ncbi:MAG: nitronate monooxygenase [Thermoleophilaceae bacterium]|nr:nitronate monooxygenase [Thermoleophilaceae bacterium]